MTPEQRERWQALAPWHTRSIEGVELGGAWQDDGLRVRQFLARFGSTPGDVLELSCLEGAHTYALAKHCRSVAALEGRDANAQRALFVGELLGAGNVLIRAANLETEDLARHGRFDAVFAAGILYHLPNPRRLIRQCAAVSDRLFLWTHLADREEVRRIEGVGRWYAEGQSSTCGLSARSFWPTLRTLRGWLQAERYHVDTVHEEPDHPSGPAITLACTRRP